MISASGLRLSGSVATPVVTDLAAGVRWRTMAVFAQAAYLLGDQRHDQVVALLAPDALQLPIGVRVPGHLGDLRRHFQVGDLAHSTGRDLVFDRDGQFCVQIGLGGRHQPSAVTVRGGWPRHEWHGDLPKVDPVLRARAGLLAQALSVGDDSGVGELVGWGQGLTPTGDDLVCGVLLALIATGTITRDQARHVIEDHSHRTTSISARLLRSAAEGHAVPQVVALVDALLDSPAAVPPALVGAVHAIGHSSGRDLCAGLAGALDHLHHDQSVTVHH